jgi:GNAT superfamily N-acetyltransferase
MTDRRSDEQASCTLRHPRPGDMGWVLERHGTLYYAEYGWAEGFETIVAEVIASFMRDHDPARERAWVAERDGERVGFVMLARHPTDPDVAKLRLLLVEPKARGYGVGARLVAECTAFARAAGYRKITLWTNSVLHSARRLYVAAGYRLVEQAPHALFGEGMIGETWELTL